MEEAIEHGGNGVAVAEEFATVVHRPVPAPTTRGTSTVQHGRVLSSVLNGSLQGIAERPLPCNYNLIQPDSALSRR